MTTNVIRTVPLVSPHRNLGANPSSLGDNSLVAAISNAKIRVLGFAVVTTASNTVKFRSNTTDISAAFPLAANGGVVLPFNEHGWFETSVGQALQINLSAATSTAVQLQYTIIPTSV